MLMVVMMMMMMVIVRIMMRIMMVMMTMNDDYDWQQLFYDGLVSWRVGNFLGGLDV